MALPSNSKPDNIPDRVLRAIGRAPIDHRCRVFADLAKSCISGVKTMFQTQNLVYHLPSLLVPVHGRLRSSILSALTTACWLQRL